MRIYTSHLRGFAVLTMVLIYVAIQAVFILPAYGDEIVGWGENDKGQAAPPAGTEFSAIAAGWKSSIALASDGYIVGWGDDVYGETKPPAGTDFTTIAARNYHNLALTSNGSVATWGLSEFGLATPPTDNGFTAIAVGTWHSLALTSNGRIIGWGDHRNGQITCPEGDGFTAIAAGVHWSLALTSEGRIVGWGTNWHGETTTPTGTGFTAIAAGSYHGLALTSDGSIVGWGRNEDDQATPPAGNDFIAIAAGGYHSLALKSDGSIVGWGRNVHGQATPPAGKNFTAIAAGGFHSLALKVNTPPVADAGGPYVVAIDESIILDGSSSYDADEDFLTYFWTQREDLEDLGVFDDDTLVKPSFTGVTAGVTELELWVSDGVDIALDSTMLVVYGPSGAFVTGGGWIDSPSGAYSPDNPDDDDLTGKANFGFVAKYKKGAQFPAGNIEFVFQSANLNFHSSSYQWLVINQEGTNAQFKGSGTVNGMGNYTFMIWAGDGDPDTFRIRIWIEDGDIEDVVYDNGPDQEIGGGSIVVHAK